MRGQVAGAVAVGLLIGAAVGVSGFTFGYAKGASYLTNDPAACANCHIMNEQYSGWLKSSHHAVAVCNDCHAPADFIGKYYTKATNGFWHSFYFTTGTFPDPIQIRARNREVTEAACRRCHADIVEALDHGGERVACLRCHNSVGHREGLGHPIASREDHP